MMLNRLLTESLMGMMMMIMMMMATLVVYVDRRPLHLLLRSTCVRWPPAIFQVAEETCCSIHRSSSDSGVVTHRFVVRLLWDVLHLVLPKLQFSVHPVLILKWRSFPHQVLSICDVQCRAFRNRRRKSRNGGRTSINRSASAGMPVLCCKAIPLPMLHLAWKM